jgi:hypothetical protein
MLRHYPFGMVNTGPADAMNEADPTPLRRQVWNPKTERAPAPFDLPGDLKSEPRRGGPLDPRFSIAAGRRRIDDAEICCRRGPREGTFWLNPRQGD